MGIRVTAHHMSFPVKDLARSREFYEGVLGLRTIPRPDLGAIAGVWYAAGACEVHLIETPAGVDPGTPPSRLNPLARHAAFAVESYDDTLAHLQAHDLTVGGVFMGQFDSQDITVQDLPVVEFEDVAAVERTHQAL